MICRGAVAKNPAPPLFRRMMVPLVFEDLIWLETKAGR